MALLSRVAESFYWMGRYVERAENTARLIMAYTNLSLDLPRSSRLQWYALIEITGSEAEFAAASHNPTEPGVMRFLINDPDNPASIRSSLTYARENLRRTRDRVPREVNESMNTLYGFMNEHGDGSIRRTAARHAFLRGVVDHCQIQRGYTGGTMSHGLGYQFIRFGRLLERADMTTRIMDVQLDDLLPADALALPSFDAIQWMAVLRSLSAYQMYRREIHGAVRAGDVIDFLFHNPEFPRSVAYCINQVRRCNQRLPRQTVPGQKIDSMLQHMMRVTAKELATDANALRATIDTLQREVMAIHSAFSKTYFEPGSPGS